MKSTDTNPVSPDCVILSAAIIAACWLIVKPIGPQELTDVVRTEINDNAQEWNDIAEALKKDALNSVINNFDKLKKIVPALESIPAEMLTPDGLDTMLNNYGSFM